MEECVIVPAYNAEKTIWAVANEALASGLPVAVIDDGSRDATVNRLQNLPLTIIRHQNNRGKGAALKSGFSWARQAGFKGIVTIDADGQHDVAAIPLLLAAAKSTGTDILIASRTAQFEQMAGLRKLWNHFGVWCLKRRTGLEISDSQSGFRYYSSRFLQGLEMVSDGYDLEMELLMKAWRGGFRIDCLPVAARVADGRSTSHFRPVCDTWNICMTFLRFF
ncbi:MAG TPA: glycosyltransferase family 2 protein [Desulfuromonadaceae bacterium]|jgi:glycosyltransferase involved in cell wall biosynthesis